MRYLVAAFFLSSVLSPPTLTAQSVDEQMRAMRTEIEALRTELQALREEVRGTVPVVAAQVQEFAQTKVESGSRFPLRLSGTIVSNTFWNDSGVDWIDSPNLAAAGGSGSFSSTLRQTRVSAAVDGPDVGPFKSSGVVALDFFGGVTNFTTGQTMGVPRLLYGYMRLDSERTSLELGQDHVIFAPRNPTSLASMSFPSLYRAGNLYLRAPQIRVERQLAAGAAGTLKLTAGIVAPIAGDFNASALQFVAPNLSGERSRRPATQARLSLQAAPAGPYEEPMWELGASGHYAQERTGVTTESWGWSADGDITIDRFGVTAEAYLGQNLDTFGSTSGPGARSRGGFVEARLAATTALSFNAGYGADRRHHGFAARPNNSGFFGNGVYQFTPEFEASLEYRRHRTVTTGTPTRNNHLNLTFAYSF